MSPTYTQGHTETVLQSQTWRTVENSAAYLLGELAPGMTVLDVGCGPGTITVDLARRVAPGLVVGVDQEPSVVERARRLADQLGISNVRFVVADVADLPAACGSSPAGFDLVHAHQLLLHVPDPVTTLRRMMASARRGGLVAVRDTDYAGMAWWPADPWLDRWLELYREIAHDHGTEPDAGRQLLGWAHAAGAIDVRSTASHWLHATPASRAAWGGMWADRIVSSSIAEEAVTGGHATPDELVAIADAWRRWAEHLDGWFLIPHGEIVFRA